MGLQRDADAARSWSSSGVHSGRCPATTGGHGPFDVYRRHPTDVESAMNLLEGGSWEGCKVGVKDQVADATNPTRQRGAPLRLVPPESGDGTSLYLPTRVSTGSSR